MTTTSRYGEDQLLRARMALASEVERGSAVLSSRVVEAFLNVSRHPFVPVFYREESGVHRSWRDDEVWLREVYADRVLVTEVDGVHAEDAGPEGVSGPATSSSTLPSLMADMLDALDVRPGDRVLEIGAGTGYNAALLCHLAGAAHVTTVDRTERLVATARTRLREAGFEPTVVQADGADGYPAAAPYDRIIATCAVRRIPRAWLDQCAPGGLIVAPVGSAVARLTKLTDGRAVGRFLHRPVGFMPLRDGTDAALEAPEQQANSRATEVDPHVLDDPGFAFWADLHLGPTVVRDGHALRDDADGSTARGRGRTVVLGGPRDLWRTVEAAHRTWLDRNRPRREWFTVEAGPEGQFVGYTAPGGARSRWDL
ncbi:methyltransferase domain-containing protein [Kitasatospora sp. NPDC048298]|uniref:methyltransferase domain-containing protein n=1 Tax=Kitasatospora sp. NPDC048298 TaxID=3364049 RepID=UPI00371EE8B5